MFKSQLVTDLLFDLYPGDDPSIIRIRDEVSRISSIPGLVIVTLEGPPGSGKTTMSRALAVCRRIFTAPDTGFRPTLASVRNEVLSQKPLTWYRDISLAGLVETLADAQLFGIGSRKASQVDARVGLFEQAMTGHTPSETAGTHESLIKSAKEKNRWAPLVTGGVVLLDEIGDLAQSLQAKLLRVLNGEKQYRVGNEGNDDYSFQFRGMTVLATWQDLESKGDFRKDLWQRIRQNRIGVPSLGSYTLNNRLLLIRSIHRQLRDQMAEELERLRELGAETRDDIVSTEWLVRLGLLSKQNLSPQTEAELCRLDLQELGEFRGLRNAVFQVMLGSSVDEFVRSDSTSREPTALSKSSKQLSLEVFGRVLKAASLSQGWKEYRLEWAREINHQLVARSSDAGKAIEEAGRDRNKIKKEIENMLRSEKSE